MVTGNKGVSSNIEHTKDVMPFTSHKQMAFLKHNHPDVYRKWVRKYGKKIRKTKKGSNKYSGALSNA